MSWCAASAVLNHGAVAPSSRAGRTRVPTSMQLVLLEHSIAQSSVGLCREMIVRAVERSCPVVVVCVQRQPQLYPSGAGVHVIDYHYRSVHDGMSLAHVERSILAAVDKLAQHTRMTVVLDSLDALVESTQCSDRAAYAFVRRLLSFLPRFSRVVLGYDGDPTASAASLVSSLRCPQLWVGIQPMHDVLSGPPWTHATLSVRVHPAAFVRYIHETYGLAPPASHASLRRAAYEDALLTYPNDDAMPPDTSPDMRFWSVVHHAARRGPWGVLDEPGSTGWWGAPPTRWASLEAGAARTHSEPVMSWDDILQDTDGCLFLETHIYQSTGKQVDEWALCAYDTHHRLRIKALDHYATAPIAPPPPQHTQVPFNLHETPQQRERRDQVPLPFAYQLQDATPRGSTGQSTIFFDPESEDDEDDDDPDDDLDI